MTSLWGRRRQGPHEMPPGVRYEPETGAAGRPSERADQAGRAAGPGPTSDASPAGDPTRSRGYPDGGAGGERPQKPPEFDWLDVVAFSIACFQLLLPGLLMMLGAVGIVYLLLWWLASRA